MKVVISYKKLLPTSTCSLRTVLRRSKRKQDVMTRFTESITIFDATTYVNSLQYFVILHWNFTNGSDTVEYTVVSYRTWHFSCINST